MTARVAFAGDWHMNAQWAPRAIAYAAEQGAEAIVHLGDFGFTFHHSFLTAVDRALEAAGLTLRFVDGNHEAFPTLYRYPVGEDGQRRLTDRIAHLPRGYRWEWGGVRFLALGGAHSVDRPYRVPGISWWPEETISRGDVSRVMAGGPADVLVSHDCPVGVVIPGVDERRGPPPFPPVEIMRANEHRQLMRSTLEAVRPAAIWHGHYHTRYTQLANLGYGPVLVNGLDCDESRLAANVVVVDVADLVDHSPSGG
jgi:predicted phosphodiesterase